MSEMMVRSALLCEMCRQEVGNKVSVMGIYSGDILVQSFPAAFPLSAYIEIEGLKKGKHRLEFSIVIPGTKMGGSADIDVFEEGEVGSLPFPMVMVNAQEAGEVTVQMRVDGNEWIVPVRRKIALGS